MEIHINCHFYTMDMGGSTDLVHGADMISIIYCILHNCSSNQAYQLIASSCNRFILCLFTSVPWTIWSSITQRSQLKQTLTVKPDEQGCYILYTTYLLYTTSRHGWHWKSSRGCMVVRKPDNHGFRKTSKQFYQQTWRFPPEIYPGSTEVIFSEVLN